MEKCSKLDETETFVTAPSYSQHLMQSDYRMFIYCFSYFSHGVRNLNLTMICYIFFKECRNLLNKIFRNIWYWQVAKGNNSITKPQISSKFSSMNSSMKNLNSQNKHSLKSNTWISFWYTLHHSVPICDTAYCMQKYHFQTKKETEN